MCWICGRPVILRWNFTVVTDLLGSLEREAQFKKEQVTDTVTQMPRST